MNTYSLKSSLISSFKASIPALFVAILLGFSPASYAQGVPTLKPPISWDSTWVGFAMTEPVTGATASEVCDGMRSEYITATPPVYFDSGTPEPPEVGDECSGGGTLSSTFTAVLEGQNCSIIEVSSYCGQLDPPFDRGPHWVAPICEPGYEQSNSDDGVCVSTADPVSDEPTDEDDMGPPDNECSAAGGGNGGVGNPINPSNGNKYQLEFDYYSGAPGSVGLSRTYNSLATSKIAANMLEPDIAGVRWHHSLDMRALVSSMLTTTSAGYVSDVFAVTLIRPDSSRLEFGIETDVYGELQWTDILRSRHNRLETVELISGTSLIYSRADGAVETYEFTHTDNDLAWMSISSIDYLNGNTADFTYDISNNLTSVTQSPGANYTLSYDVNGRISQIAVPGGNVSYAYDIDGNIQSVTYPDSSSRTYVYEDVLFPNALTGIYDENGARFSTYAYDSEERGILTKQAGDTNMYTLAYLGGYQTDVTDPFNQTITYEHKDVNGRAQRSAVSSLSNTCSSTALSKEFDYTTGKILEEKDAFGIAINSYNFMNDDKTVEVTNAEYVTTTYEYLDAARLSKVTKDTTEVEFLYDLDARLDTRTVRDLNTYEEKTTTFTYNIDGRVASIDGPRTDVTDLTSFTYHASGDLASETNALSQVTSYANYTADGRVGKMTEPSGLVTDLTYTARGWLDTVTQLGLVTDYDYDAVGNLTRVTYPDSSIVDYVYDDAHRLTEIIDHNGNRLVYTLDEMGNRIKKEIIDSTSSLLFTQSKTFDDYNRLKTIVGALNQTTEFEYDDNGNLIGFTDPLSIHTSLQLDSLNRPTTATNDYSGISTSQFYHLDGNLASVEDYNYNQTTYSYDGLSQLVDLTSPETGTTLFLYDGASNLIEKTDADGRVLTNTFDALNRALTENGTGYSVTYGYDEEPNSIGKLGTITDNSGTTKWYYENIGTIAEKVQTPTGGTPLSTDYTYNATGQLQDMEYPSGNIINYVYAADGKLSTVNLNSGAFISSIDFAPFGAISGWTPSNLASYSRSFNLDGRVSSVTYPDTVRNYTYDDAYQTTLIDDTLFPSDTESMVYESMGRLESYTKNSVTTDYYYDANGTRYETYEGSEYRTFTAYVNQIQDVYRNDLGVYEAVFTYDLSGNRTAKDTLNYTYNESGRLIQVDDGGIIQAAYEYNALGQRVRKEVGGVTTHYVYDEGTHLIGEYPSVGSDIEYVWIDGTPVAMLLSDSLTLQVFFIHPDQLNTPRFMTDSSGSVVWRWDSDGFGNGLADEDPDNDTNLVTMNLRFSGQQFDAETLTYYNYFRDFDPELGGYLQSDPIGLKGGLNTYGYALQSPFVFTDPLGLEVVLTGRPVSGTAGLGAHSRTTVTKSDGSSVTYSSHNVNGKNVVRKNHHTDHGPTRIPTSGLPVIVPPPPGMTQDEWDDAVIAAAEALRLDTDPDDYNALNLFGGTNCHVTTNRVLFGAGGRVPSGFNPPGYNPGL